MSRVFPLLPLLLIVLCAFRRAAGVKSYAQLAKELSVHTPEEENWEATVNLKILDSQGKTMLQSSSAQDEFGERPTSESESPVLKAKLKRALRVMGRFFSSDWKKHLTTTTTTSDDSKKTESIAKDSGNDWMMRDATNDALYYYEGGKDAVGKRSGKGILIGKLDDYMYVGGYCADKRHGFGVEITLRSASYYSAAALYSAGKRVIRLPIPCPMRRLIEKLFTCPDRIKLLRCILWHVPICRCASPAKGVNGENSTPPPLQVTPPPDPNTLLHQTDLGFSVEGGMSISKSRHFAKIENFKSSFKYSWTFLVNSKFSGVATVQAISLTKFFAPQIRVHKCMYRINRHLDPDPSSPSYVYLDHGHGEDSRVSASVADRESPLNGHSSVPVSWVERRSYVIEVGTDEAPKDSSFPALKNGEFFVRIGEVGDPLPWYSEFLGCKFQSVCVDWKYSIGLSEGGKIDQYLSSSESEKLSGAHVKRQYVCGLLNLKIAPTVDLDCGAVIFYYTDGEIQTKQGGLDPIKRSGSVVLRQGENSTIGFTREVNLYYDTECKHHGVDSMVNRVRSWARIPGSESFSSVPKGLTIKYNSCITSLHRLADIPTNFKKTLTNSHVIMFTPMNSAMYNVMLFSATVNYHPSLRIFDHKTGDSRDSGENIEIRPVLSESSAGRSYQLCCGKTYILEVGISSSSKVYSEENGDFWAFFSNSPVTAAQRIKTKEFSPQGGDNITTNYKITLQKEGLFKQVINETPGGEKIIGTWDPELVPYVNLRESWVDFFYPDQELRSGNPGPLTLGILRVHAQLPKSFLRDAVEVSRLDKAKVEVTVAHVADPGAISILALINNSA